MQASSEIWSPNIHIVFGEGKNEATYVTKCDDDYTTHANVSNGKGNNDKSSGDSDKTNKQKRGIVRLKSDCEYDLVCVFLAKSNWQLYHW